MALWQVFTLDVWGNEEDGFEVNDRACVGSIETSDNATNEELCACLLDAGIAYGSLKDASFEGAYGFVMINERESGRPVFQLERQ